MKLKNVLIAMCASMVLSGNIAHAANAKDIKIGKDPKEVKIGLAIDDIHADRWKRDRELFVAKAESMGAKVIVQAANNNEETQIAQIENLINSGIDVLVIVPYNDQAINDAIAEAKNEGVKVIAYDRLVNNADIDYYISFDNEKVGQMQAKSLVKQVPEGNYFLIGGSPADNNAKVVHKGQMDVLRPLVRDGKIKIVGDKWAENWKSEDARKMIEKALSENKKIDAIVVSNDDMAGGAIQALTAHGLAGKVAVSGQDADLAAIKRIEKGTQTMTVYKPIKSLAEAAAEAAVGFGTGKEGKSNTTINNGYKDVPAYMLTPIEVDKSNIDTTVIADGFHSKESIK